MESSSGSDTEVSKKTPVGKSILSMMQRSQRASGRCSPDPQSTNRDPPTSVRKSTQSRPVLDPAALTELRRKIKEQKKRKLSTEEDDVVRGEDSSLQKGPRRKDLRAPFDLVKARKASNSVAKKLLQGTTSSAPLEVESNSRQFDPNFEARKPKPQKVVGDPRFRESSGNLDVDAVGRNYAFVDDLRAEERAELGKHLRKTVKKNNGRKTGGKWGHEAEELAGELQRLQQEEKKREELHMFQQTKRALQQKERGKALTGKKVYYHSTSEIRKQVRKEKLDKMGTKSREKLLAKREKRQASGEKKKMVSRRESV